jgi:hypothetical protein
MGRRDGEPGAIGGEMKNQAIQGDSGDFPRGLSDR